MPKKTKQQQEKTKEQEGKKRSYKNDYKWWEDLGKIAKLEQAFAMGCTDKEACALAEISLDQLYYYTTYISPDFQLRKDELKEQPFLTARKTVVDSLGEPEHAKWFLERKLKKEFALRTETTGAEGENIKVDLNIENLSNEDLLKILKEK